MNNKYTCIIVDDERKARKLLRYKIEDIDPEIEILDEAANAKEAIELVSQTEPDIIFLDISMPEVSGLELLEKIKDNVGAAIFVTSYDSYAIEAINQSAQGYLLKPIIDADLVKVLKKVKQGIDMNIQSKINLESLNAKKGNVNEKILGIPFSDGLEFININNIVHCEGWQKYTRVHMKNDSTLISSYNIGEFLNILVNLEFYQVHRSHIVNLNEIKKYLKDGTIIMSNGNEVPVSRRKRQQFLDTITRL